MGSGLDLKPLAVADPAKLGFKFTIGISDPKFEVFVEHLHFVLVGAEVPWDGGEPGKYPCRTREHGTDSAAGKRGQQRFACGCPDVDDLKSGQPAGRQAVGLVLGLGQV